MLYTFFVLYTLVSNKEYGDMQVQRRGKHNHRTWGHQVLHGIQWGVVLVAILVITVSATIWIFVSVGLWPAILTAIFGALVALFGFFQLLPLLFSSTAHHKESSSHSPHTSSLSPSRVFLFDEPLTDPHSFYGREIERETLLQRTYCGASTSIIGPPKIGKTWLVDYLLLLGPTELGSHFCFAYLDATAPSCKTVAGFTLSAVNGLGFPLARVNRGLAELEKVIRELTAKNVIPVLCIDEFEGLSNQQEFTFDFFQGLRAMTQKYGLILVVVSKEPLAKIVVKEVETSGFFNVFEPMTIRPFGVEEARVFIEEKCIQAGFTEQERKFLWKYGQEGEQQWPPMRLQLVGKCLLEEKLLAEREGLDGYRPPDPHFWWEFEQRLKEKYEEYK